jgi:long-chain fatty acid transport protein
MKNAKTLRMTALAVALAAPSAFATNGYFTHGVGAHNKSQAGAGLAAPTQAIDAANNPASAILVDEQTYASLSIFSPRRSYTASTSQFAGNGPAFSIMTQGELDSKSNYFPLPALAKKWTLGDDSALVFSFYGRGGMNTDWKGGSANFDTDQDGTANGPFGGTFGAAAFGGPAEAGVDLMQAFVELAWAKKVSDTVSLGIAPVVVIQAFEAKGLEAFTPYTKTFLQTFMNTGDQMAAFGAVDSLTGNGHEYSTGLGIKLGAHFQLSDNLALALAYQPEISMSEFDDYADLFADAGGFDIPASARVGLSFQATPSFSVHLDGETISYSDIGSVGNSGTNIFQCPSANPMATNAEACLGGSQGAGFGWDDMTVIKLGFTWAQGDTTYRAGISQGDQPIGSGEVLFNILAPGVIEQHLTFGMAKKLADNREWGFSFMYAPEESVSGTSMFDPSQTIELSMKQFELEFYYTW